MHQINTTRRVQAIDSHTAGEPTRLIIDGGPDLGNGPLSERLHILQKKYDNFRSAVVNEPRGSDVLVGALLCPPTDPSCAAGIIFFNNVGYLGMCGHGTMGVVVTLAHMGKIGPGRHKIETPVGIVHATLTPGGEVTVDNVPSYLAESDVTVDVPSYGKVKGNIAWGGNWFFMVEDHEFDISLHNVDTLTEFTWSIRRSLDERKITGRNGSIIDHVELFAPSPAEGIHSKNFVLCPGKAYDRSPCGTGTSAKLACLYAEKKLAPGEIWHQEGILGTVFHGSFQVENGHILPSITGSAYVTAECTLLLDPKDPFCMGIPR